MESILDDVIALIHKRETELHTELDKLGNVRELLNGAETTAVAGPAVAIQRKARRTLTPAQRKRISRRMRQTWKARRAAKS
jgi:hypothetical protein